MGNLCSSPSDKYEAGGSAGGGGGAAGGKRPKVPTFGLLPDYEVIKLLGTGGEGETWLTTDTATRKTVAIKARGRSCGRAP